jgi:SAM-dependent methyltransferase
MKTRDSGMPDAGQWRTFFDPETILRTLGLERVDGTIVDVGCGYGTFTLPAARLSAQRVIALDIEGELVASLREEARRAGVAHLVEACVQDVAAHGTGLADASAAVVLLFNLLHCEEPLRLLEEAKRILIPGGRVAVIHWRSDVPTPRGPALAIRPTPAQCRAWLEQTGFGTGVAEVLLPPYHFGLVGRRPLRPG